MSAAAKVLDACRAKGWHVAAAESCTGGLVMAALTEIPGSSDVVERGFVTYSNAAKVQLLGVSPETLERVGAVSEETAREMAEGALARSEAELAVSITGIAGPGGSEHKPEGRVCFGLARTGAPTLTRQIDFGPIGRSAVRAASVDTALSLLLDAARAE
ncbi:CinA family protein [Oceanibium sediminis]|uniref:CinA family protein n=1 Tax=Oceanibium sediminis TaxID=2026339 RepID=UPI000DD47B31|nr:nicotinamide-nucleotide amidohydrolase family protein [Oceanibium sediminis]